MTGPSKNYTSIDTDELVVSNALYDIRDYGAVGDGATDNHSAISSAISDADSNGGDVFIPAGDFYYGSTLDVSNISEVTIRGVGDSSILRHDDVSDDGITGSGLSGVTFESFRLVGNPSAGRKQQGLQFSSSDDVEFRRLRVEDWDGDGIVWFAGCSNVRVIDCDVENTGDDGINPGGTGSDTTDSLIRGCRVSNVTNDGIHVSVGTYGLDIEDCHLDGCPIAFTNNVREVTISGGSVKNAPQDAIYSKSSTEFYGVSIAGTRIRNPGLYGVQLQHGEDHTIENVHVYGGDRGIDVRTADTDVIDCKVVSANAQTELSGAADWGIVFTGGADFNATVSGNNVKGTFANDNIYVDGTRATVNGNACDGSIGTGSSADYNTFSGNIAPGGITTTGANSVKSANIEL